METLVDQKETAYCDKPLRKSACMLPGNGLHGCVGGARKSALPRKRALTANRPRCNRPAAGNPLAPVTMMCWTGVSVEHSGAAPCLRRSAPGQPAAMDADGGR